MPPENQPDSAPPSKAPTDQPENEPVTLPPNVSIYNGASGEKLLNAEIFTRLETTVQDQHQLTVALSSDLATFCIQHHNILVIFDNDQDSHHEHFRQAGFQLDKLNEGSILLVDLQYDEEDSSDDDSDDGDSAAEA
ncbi:hypothetical protein G7Z17_g2782 [Cylindrodendrum hubeiense]|uniref:Uncharacterized protein n=1 Tax=Cylindrodendrum hubeiense TaxID=595255 RepID=A0A9P5HH50_9HYPO|nr:hypothetical protein G7Z17_g2782 [Cylindrodendrum hubeiense]